MDRARRHRRLRPIMGWTGVYSEDLSFRLPEETRKELIDIAGLEFSPEWAEAMVRHVERVLSQYPTLYQALDAGPRPAHRRESLRRVDELLENFLANARALGNFLRSSDEARWDLTVHGFHFARHGYALADRLTTLTDDADIGQLRESLFHARKSLQRQESRHGPTHRARARVVRELSHVFDFFNRDQTGENGRPLDSQRLKADFVSAALRGARIPCQRVGVIVVGRTSELHFQRAQDTPSRSRLVRAVPPKCDRCRGAGRVTAEVVAGMESGPGCGTALSLSQRWWDTHIKPR